MESTHDFLNFSGESPGIYYDFQKFSDKNPGIYHAVVAGPGSARHE